MVGNTARGTTNLVLAMALASSMMLLPGGLANEQDGETGTVEYVGPTPTLIPGGSVQFLTGDNGRILAILNVRDNLDRGGPLGWTVGGAFCQVEAGDSACTPGVDGAPAIAFCEGITLTPSNFDPAMDTYVHVGAPFDRLSAVIGGNECTGPPKVASTGTITFWPAA